MYAIFVLSLLLAPTLTYAQAVATTTSPYDPGATGRQYLQNATDLTITAWEELDCRGNSVTLHAVPYGEPWSVQFNSFKPSRQLNPPERMDLFNALPEGGKLNSNYNGHPEITCKYFFDSPSENDVNTGCHNTIQAMGCMKVWLPPRPYPRPHKNGRD